MSRRRHASIRRASAFLLVSLLASIGIPEALAAPPAPPPAAHTLTLVVAGDGRSDPSAKPPRPEDRDCLNAAITAEMRDAVLKEKASALMWTGDLVYGAYKDLQCPSLESQLDSWVAIMEPLWKEGVQVLPVRGNHEAFSRDGEEAWKAVFRGRHKLPKTGPAGAKGFTYWITIENVLILGIDQYAYADEISPVPWVRETLKAHQQQHVFAFGHEMAFMSGRHRDNLSVNAQNRDDLMNVLIGAGSKAFFAGHDHFYDHLIARGKTGTIHQFVAGTAGAPLYPDDGYVQQNPGWTTERVLHLPKAGDPGIVYGYITIVIEGPKATITFKGRTAPGRYEPMDTWSYEAP
jgi:calcineurin-like phosphoesterase family protein